MWVIGDKGEQSLCLARIRRDPVGQRVGALLLDAREILRQSAVSSELFILEELQRPAVQAFPVAAQVLDVQHQVRRVLGQLALRMRQRDPRQVLARLVVTAGDVFEPAHLEGDFHRVRVGVGRPDSTDPDVVAAYVLSRFAEPSAEVRSLVERAADEAERLVTAPVGAPQPE